MGECIAKERRRRCVRPEMPAVTKEKGLSGFFAFAKNDTELGSLLNKERRLPGALCVSLRRLDYGRCASVADVLFDGVLGVVYRGTNPVASAEGVPENGAAAADEHAGNQAGVAAA